MAKKKAAETEEKPDYSPEKIMTGIKKPGSKGAKITLDELKTEIERNLTIAVNDKKKWKKVAKEDIDFSLGEQWTAEQKAQLELQNRPALTFNKIKPMIQLITGHMIQNNARIQASPEGGEDQLFSEVTDKILSHIDKVSHLKYQLAYLFAGGERAGRSWIGFELDYEEDPIFGQLKIPYLGPFKVFMDPNGEGDYSLSDCEYGFKVIKISKGKLKQIYPNKAKEIDAIGDDTIGQLLSDKGIDAVEGDRNNYGIAPGSKQTGINDIGTPEDDFGDFKQLTTIEYFKKAKVDRFFVYFADDGSTDEFDTEAEAKAAVENRKKSLNYNANRQRQDALLQASAIAGVDPSTVPPVEPLPEMEVEHIIRKRRVDRMHMAVMAGDVFLTDGLVLSPFEPHYHGFPWVHYMAQWSPDTENPELRVQGLVRCLKDPQCEVNKARSQFLHMINTSANSGWIGDEDALTETGWSELKEFGSKPGIIVRKKAGSSLQRIEPVAPSVAQTVREKAATDDFKEVSGINADLLSIDTSSDPSGKAIALRMKQAITVLQPDFENFRYTKYMIGQLLFRIIPSMFDAIKLEKILGQKFMETNGMDRGRLQAYLTMIEEGRYNIEISESGNVDTLRNETFEDLMTLLEKGMQLPPDLILDFMNLPNKEEALQKIQQFQQQQQLAAQAAAGATQQPQPGQ